MDNSGKMNVNIVQLRKPRHWFGTFAAAWVFILVGAVANVLNSFVLNSFVSIFGFDGLFDLAFLEIWISGHFKIKG